MGIEYWQIAAESLLDECGISATTEQTERLGKRLNDAASMEDEYCGAPSSQAGKREEVNPYKDRCERMQQALDAMGRRYGVIVDADRMEVQWHGHVGGTIYGTHREKI